MSDYSLQARESDTGRTLKILSHVAKLESALDMQRDEFKRIIALAPSLEIVGLCERAITAIEKTVPVVVERDKLQTEVEERRYVMADIVRVMGFGCSGLAGERIAPAVAKLRTRVADLEKQLKQIYDVATGQEQVAFDDTLGMVWIAEYITEQRKIP